MASGVQSEVQWAVKAWRFPARIQFRW